MGKADSINVSKEAAGKFVTGGTPAASTSQTRHDIEGVGDR
jgi:hypothetical protein